MNKIPLFLLSLFLLGVPSATFGDLSGCEEYSGYDMYTCRVKNSCEKYKPTVVVFNTQTKEREYLEDYNLYIAKNLYRKNMNNIYKCAIFKSQNNAYRIVTDKLGTPFSGVYKELINTKSLKNTAQIQRLGCEESEISHFKYSRDVLNASTFEMCKYLNFLDYIKTNHINDIGNLIKDTEISQSLEERTEQNPEEGAKEYVTESQKPDYTFEQTSYTIGHIIKLDRNARDELDEEIQHTKRVYEVAFQTFSNYESNMVIHVLLNLLENDFMQLRNNIYVTISPINQVVYKIANAMSK